MAVVIYLSHTTHDILLLISGLANIDAAMLLFLITKNLLILVIVSFFNMVGVELKPGQTTCGMHRELNQINFGHINARSAVN